MKRLSLIPIILLAVWGSAMSQPDTLWTKHYGLPWTDWCTSMVNTTDGGYVLGNYSQQDSGGVRLLSLQKTDADGDSLWRYYYGMDIVDHVSYDLQQISDGGFILVGYAGEDPDQQATALRTDANGTSEWLEYYGGALNEIFTSVVQCSDGGFICAGNSNAPGDQQIYIMKIDAGGNTIWTHYYGDTNAQYVYCIIALNDGNYMIGGYTYITVPFTYLPFLLKVNSAGDSLWQGTYPDATGEIKDFKQTTDGGYICALQKQVGWSFDGGCLKVNSAGSQEWCTTVGGQQFDTIIQTVEGSYVMAGTYSTMAAPQATHLAKLSSGGGIIWDLQLDLQPGLEWGKEIVQTADGGYTLAGTDWNNTMANQMYLVKFAEEVTPDVSITLTPENPPIQIPAGGGIFNFNVLVSNSGTSPVAMDVWTNVTLPNGSTYGPLINAPDITMPASWSGNRDRNQSVPASAPAGSYTHNAYIGIYPNMVYDEDNFDFTKTAASDGSIFISDWNNWGESFETFSEPVEIADDYVIHSVYPNPFNPAATIRFELTEAADVSVKIYDVNGRLAATLIEETLNSGLHEVEFDGTYDASGMYFYKITAGSQNYFGKMLLLK